MKHLFLLSVLLLSALTLQAQRTISGRVIDKEQQEAVIQATVALLKSDSTSIVTNAVTNATGNFQMTAPQDGTFLLRVTFVGYKPLWRSITVSGKPVQMGTLTMETDAIVLKGTEVVKNLAKVYSKEDTLIYNAGAYKTPEGSVVEELVKKLPGAEVADDGSITINGKKVQKIKVDGKEFMTGDTQTAIKNLPTSIVERVKAYDEKSDLTRITGIDDGEEQTVLDFGLKRGMNRGTFTNIDGGIGSHHRYSGRAMGAQFNSDMRLMGFANANNVNDMGFGGGGGGGRFGGGGRNGLQATKMVGANFNYEKSDRETGRSLKLDGSVRWNHGDGDTWSRRATENFVSSSGAFSNSVSQSYSRSNSWNAQFRVEWMPDSMWNIHFRPSFSYSSNDGSSTSVSASFREDPYNYVDFALNTPKAIWDAISVMQQVSDTLVVNSSDNGSMSYSDDKRIGGELQVNRKLSSNGRNVTLRLTGNYTDGDSKNLSLQDVTLYQLMNYRLDGDSTYMKNRYNLTPSKNYSYSARVTYSEPIAQQTYLQFSYDFQYRHTKSDRSTYDFSMPTPYPIGTFTFADLGLGYSYRDWNSYLSRLEARQPLSRYYDESLSRYSEYNNYIHTGEIMLRVVRKTYNFNVGVQVMPQTSEFTYRYLKTDTVTRRNVINWSPTANFRWKKSDRSQLRFTYRGNTSQPSMSDMLPIIDDSDPLNISVGNPGLKPSFTQDLNLRYNDFWERHQQFLFANVAFSTTSNAVTSKVYYDPVTGGRVSTRDNINGNWNTRAELMFNTALDTLGTFNFNTRTSFQYAHSVSYLDAYSVSHDDADKGNILKNAMNETNLSERLGASFRTDNFEFELNGGVSYRFGRNKLQSQGNQDTWAFNYGFNTTYSTDWGMQLTTNLNMSSRRGYSDASMNTNELIWNAQIAQSFLKGRPLSVRLEFYDILRRQSSFSRMLSAMQRSDTEYNAINSYIMLRVNYRLNLFGSKEAREGMRMGPPGVQGGPGSRGGRGGRGGFGGGPGGGGFGGPGRF